MLFLNFSFYFILINNHLFVYNNEIEFIIIIKFEIYNLFIYIYLSILIYLLMLYIGNYKSYFYYNKTKKNFLFPNLPLSFNFNKHCLYIDIYVYINNYYYKSYFS